MQTLNKITITMTHSYCLKKKNKVPELNIIINAYYAYYVFFVYGIKYNTF